MEIPPASIEAVAILVIDYQPVSYTAFKMTAIRDEQNQAMQKPILLPSI